MMRSREKRRGQALVEFAFVVPLMLFVLLIAIDFGRLFFTYIQRSNAAREGAAYGSMNPMNMPGITTHATQETGGQAQVGENATTVSATCADQSGNLLTDCSTAAGASGIG